ncbi:MAG: aminoacyl-tRNA hydrolase, partial [Firmicutes bacterium]|nr:aminoacyl-tRNA hydrolase [Bacillota bacterium]
PRIRIGLGDHGIIPLDRFVISKPTEEEQKILTQSILDAADAAVCIVEKGVDEAMQKFNRK